MRNTSFRRSASLVGLCFVLSTLVLGSGCSKKEKVPKDYVGGKVLLEEKAVAGRVVFVYIKDNNKEVSTPIKQDGTYRMDNPPQGQVKVLVKSLLEGAGGGPKPIGAPPMKDAKMPTMPGDGEAPPDKYGDVKTSPLTFEVTGGQQTNDITLEKGK